MNQKHWDGGATSAWVLITLWMIIGISTPALAAHTPAQTSQPNAQVTQAIVPGGAIAQPVCCQAGEALERQADRHYQYLSALLEKGLWIFTGLIGIAAVLFAWFLGSSRSEARRLLNERFQEVTEELLQEKTGEIRSQVQSIATEISELTAYQKREVLWLIPNSEKRPNQEIEALHAMGLSRITVRYYSEEMKISKNDTLEAAVRRADLIIVSYDGSDRGRTLLDAIARTLAHRKPPVYMIIYLFNQGGEPLRMNGEDFSALGQYLWYVPAQFPSQLVLQAKTLIDRKSYFEW